MWWKLWETLAKEIESYSLVVDSTSDISHNEKNNFIFRYLTHNIDDCKTQVKIVYTRGDQKVLSLTYKEKRQLNNINFIFQHNYRE